jgi:hypothetical protein
MTLGWGCCACGHWCWIFMEFYKTDRTWIPGKHYTHTLGAVTEPQHCAFHSGLETLFTSATAPNERQSYSHKVRIGQRLIPKNYIQKEKLLSSSESSCVFINFRVSMCVCVYLHECSEPLKKFYILIVPNGSNQQRLNQYNCM